MSSFPVKAHRYHLPWNEKPQGKIVPVTSNLHNGVLLEQYLSWEPKVHLLLVTEKACFHRAILGKESSPEPTRSHLTTRQMLQATCQCSAAGARLTHLHSAFFPSDFRIHFQKQLLDRSNTPSCHSMVWTFPGSRNLHSWTRASKPTPRIPWATSSTEIPSWVHGLTVTQTRGRHPPLFAECTTTTAQKQKPVPLLLEEQLILFISIFILWKHIFTSEFDKTTLAAGIRSTEELVGSSNGWCSPGSWPQAAEIHAELSGKYTAHLRERLPLHAASLCKQHHIWLWNSYTVLPKVLLVASRPPSNKGFVDKIWVLSHTSWCK